MRSGAFVLHRKLVIYNFNQEVFMYKLTLTIDGMASSMCESHVNDAIRRAFSVSKVTSSHKKNLTEIICDTPLDESALHKAIEATGYKVLSVSCEPYKKKKKRFLFF